MHFLEELGNEVGAPNHETIPVFPNLYEERVVGPSIRLGIMKVCVKDKAGEWKL